MAFEPRNHYDKLDELRALIDEKFVGDFDWKASLAHLLVCAIFRFTPWLAGPTRHIAGFLSLGAAYNATERIEEIPFVALLLVGLVMAVLWSGTFLLATRLGARKRLADRAELMGGAQ